MMQHQQIIVAAGNEVRAVAALKAAGFRACLISRPGRLCVTTENTWENGGDPMHAEAAARHLYFGLGWQAEAVSAHAC